MKQADAYRLTWTLARRGGCTKVVFDGAIDECADLSALCTELIGAVELHLGGVRRINSAGVHRWIDFVRALPAVTELVLTHCSPAIVAQLNMTYGFAGRGRVESLYAPFACDDCGHEQLELLRTDQLDGRAAAALRARDGPGCGGELQLDDRPDRYLSFLTFERGRRG